MGNYITRTGFSVGATSGGRGWTEGHIWAQLFAMVPTHWKVRVGWPPCLPVPGDGSTLSLPFVSCLSACLLAGALPQGGG